jgi:hypothetical protein
MSDEAEREPGEPINMAHHPDYGVLLPTKDGQGHWVSNVQMKEWQGLQPYRRLDVRGEVVKMQMWLEVNPEKRKINTRKFVVAWLNKASNLPGNPGETTARAAAGHRERVQAQAQEERSKPVAAGEVARKALTKALAMLGQSHSIKGE